MNSKLSDLPHVTFDFTLNNSHNIVHRPPFENLVHSRNFLVEMIPVQRKQEIKICSLLNMIDNYESNAVLCDQKCRSNHLEWNHSNASY